MHLQSFRFLSQDCRTCLVVRRLDIDHKAAFETGLDALFQERLARRFIAGYHDLSAGHMEFVKRVEEAFLGLRLAGDELDVVHQERVGASIERPELFGRAGLDGANVVVSKSLTADVDHLHAAGIQLVADGLKEVCFA